MLTDEQASAAEKALKELKTQKLKKRIALHYYRACIDASKEYRLPFRLLYRREGYLPGEIRPSSVYPLPSAFYRDGLGEICGEVPQESRLTIPEQKDYYFTKFLARIDLDDYSDGDLTGERISKEEADRIRNEYRRRIEAFRSHPEQFDTEPHYVTEEDKQQFFGLWDDQLE